jgi:fibronectin-binding autotransporter adhesin
VRPVIQNGGLTKTDVGTLFLSGANTYVGEAMIDSGSLVVTGSFAASTVVANDAMLGCTGILNGSVPIQGTLQPGNNAQGTLNLGNTNFTLGSGRKLGASLPESAKN